MEENEELNGMMEELNEKFNQKMEEREEEIENERVEQETREISQDVEKLKKELEEVTDRHTRLIAEFDNLKKRSQKEREGLYDSVKADIITGILPVIDNLEKAASAESKDENYKNGIKLVLKQFKDVLEANGIKEIEAVGKPFNPELHEAISMIQDPNLGEKIIAEEYRKGYTIGDRVIRHSMVIVAN